MTPEVLAGRRAVTIRHEVTGTLETVTAVRVGAWGASTEADLVVARDGLGRIVIPGTSLAGALRAWLGSVTAADGRPLFDQSALGKVFGDLKPGSQDAELCRIGVDDAVAAEDVALEIRDGVGIDRVTATAATHVLYQHQVIPLGTRLAMRITASQSGADPERVGEALSLLVAALTEGRVELGAARTRGLGRVRLTDARHARVDLTDRDQVLAWLSGQLPPAPGTETRTTVEVPPSNRLDIEISWSPVTPVMVQASTVNEPEPDPSRDHPVDTVPLRVTNFTQNGPARLLLPGASIKGVLRSHAERIMRTLLGIPPEPGKWLDQVNDDRLAPVGVLFGAAGDHSARTGRGNSGKPGRRGALSVNDCHGTVTADPVITHVAVDRWTGGAAENLLFSVQEPADANWEPIRLSLDTRWASGGAAGADSGRAVALLLLVLRDLADGWLALGFGGTRGRGAIQVSRVMFSGPGLVQPWASLCGRTLKDLIEDPPEGVGQVFASWREVMPA
jgi:CRISPR/Cas system CSM-associated protein Csm3 (group 7 of RAMP superfamily)